MRSMSYGSAAAPKDKDEERPTSDYLEKRMRHDSTQPALLS